MSNAPEAPAATASPAGDTDKGFWDWIIRRSPKVGRFLLGGYAVLAVAGLVLAWRVSIALLTTTAIVVVTLSVVIGLLTSALSRRQKALAASAFLWSIVVFILVLMLLFVSSAFFGLPRGGALLVARIADSPQLIISEPSQILEVSGGAWPKESTAPLDVEGTEVDRIKALTERPSLRLLPDRPLGGGQITVNVLELEGESVVTNGAALIIEAVKIRSNGGVIRSFPSESKSTVGRGQSAGSVTLIVHDRIIGRLVVDLTGQAGGDGRNGAAGSRGGQGAQGENAASGLFDCKHGPGRGDPGGRGGDGENGQDGAPGGDGGTLTLVGPHPEQLTRGVTAVLSGGPGGVGGTGGPGGAGGPGGRGGSSNGICQGTGPDGAVGADGNPGQPGRRGSTGHEGRIELKLTDKRGELP